MGQRLELHAKLSAIPTVKKAYFQQPPTTGIEYPCIIYKRDSAETTFADNNPYSTTKRYMVTVIDKNPDSTIPDAVAKLPMCRFDRHYTADNLNHDVFNLYF